MNRMRMRCRPSCWIGWILALCLGLTAGASVPEETLRTLAAQADQELRGNILPFWLKYARDPSCEGMVGAIEGDMAVKPGAPRGALLTSRLLWTFSAAYRRYPQPEYLEMAKWAYRDLTTHFKDREQGGYFWTITADGKPLDTHKQVYGQVFAIYALAEYYRATGDAKALEEAKSAFLALDQHAHDNANGGYYDSLDRGWERKAGERNNVLGRAEKTQNSHIHILEAFSNLLRVWPDERLENRQRELIELMLTRIVDSKHHLILFMKNDWSRTSDEISYGHDIELSWLVVEAAEVLGDKALLERCRSAALDIARVTLAEGVDKDGAVLNEGGPKGITNGGKDWWSQAEGVVGFINAYQLSGDEKYLEAAAHTWAFIQARVVDRVHGDWYESLNRDGAPRKGMKLSTWKCPYHNSRSCMEILDRAGRLSPSK